MSRDLTEDLEPRAARTEGATGSHSVQSLAERLRDQQLAWGVLAPSCITSGAKIVEAGRAIREKLSRLSQSASAEGGLEGASLALERLGNAICQLAFEAPISQLRSSFPNFLRSDRRGLLALLDLLAGHAFENPGSLGPKLDTIDYLITLLCTEGDPQGRVMPQDPVQLTPRLQQICRRAESEYDPQLAQIEAEFFSASNLDQDLRDAVQLQSLRARKAELGKSYFAPRMLRAIVTYNVALVQCVAAEVQEARDWGAGAEPEPSHAPRASVFECEALRSLHEAVRRRLERGRPETSAVGQLAWALDLDYPNASERSLLRNGPLLSPDGVPAAIVLVGLLCRSLSVLAIELQSIGIDPDGVSDWAKELDELLKGEVNSLISSDSYREACMLSELRNKFLYGSALESHGEVRGPRPPTTPEPNTVDERDVRQKAKQLAGEALAQRSQPPGARRREDTSRWSDLSWRRIVPAGLAILVAAVLGLQLMGAIDLQHRGLDRFSGRELERLSPHLARGHRNGDGAGPAFVGTIDEGWSMLGERERHEAAEELVAGLRRAGVTQVMIYDGAGRLRIQALGQTLHTL